MDNREQEATKIVDEMNKQMELSKLEELIKDNKITFEYKDKQYRVRLLNLKEKEELDTLRRKKFGQLIQDKDILLEKDLIEQYKLRGIDINDIDEQVKKIDIEEKAILVQLGSAIAKNETEMILKEQEDKVKELRIKKQVLFTQKNLFLTYSLENQLLSYVAEIITYLSLDVQEDGWKRKFNSIDDFINYEDENLISLAAQYSMLLQYSI